MRTLADEAPLRISAGEFFILKAVRENCNTKRKIYKYLIGTTPEQVDNLIGSVMSKGLLSSQPIGIFKEIYYFLTERGLETALKYELEKPERIVRPTHFVTQISHKEIVTDKILGSVIMVAGFFALYIGFRFAMLMYYNPAQNIPLQLDGVLEQYSPALASTIAPMLGSIIATVKIGAIGLIIWIGSILTGKGIQLFKRA